MDHREGNYERVVGDQVNLAPVGQVVEQTVDDRCGLVAHAADGPGSEGALDQLAESCVVRRVEAQDRRCPLFIPFGQGLHVLGNVVVVLPPYRGVWVAQYVMDVVVAGDQQCPDQGAVHRVVVAQLPVVGIGVGHEAGVQRVPGHLLGRRHRLFPFTAQIIRPTRLPERTAPSM